MSASGNSSFSGRRNEESVEREESLAQRACGAELATPVPPPLTHPTGEPTEDEEETVEREVALEEQAAQRRLADSLAEDRMGENEYARRTAALRLLCDPLHHVDNGQRNAAACPAASTSTSAMALPKRQGDVLKELLRVPNMSEEDWEERRRGRCHRHHRGRSARGHEAVVVAHQQARSSSLSRASSSLWGSSDHTGSDDDHNEESRARNKTPSTAASTTPAVSRAAHGAKTGELGTRSTGSTVCSAAPRPVPQGAGRRACTQRPPPLLPCTSADEGIQDDDHLLEPPPLIPAGRRAPTSTAARTELGVVSAESADTRQKPPGSRQEQQSGRKRLRLHLGGADSGSSPCEGEVATGAAAAVRAGRTLSLSLNINPTSSGADANRGALPKRSPLASTTEEGASRPRRVLSLVSPATAAAAAAVIVQANGPCTPSTQLDSVATLSTTGPFSSPRSGGGGGVGGAAAGGHISVISSPFSPGTPGWPAMTPTGEGGGGRSVSAVGFPTFADGPASRSGTGHGDEDDLLGDGLVADRTRSAAQTDRGDCVQRDTEKEKGTSSYPAAEEEDTVLSSRAQADRPPCATPNEEMSRPLSRGTHAVAAVPSSARSPRSPITHMMLDSDTRDASLTPTPAVHNAVPTRVHSHAGVPLPVTPMSISFDTVKAHVQDHYSFRKKISEGTYGEVYVGVDKRTNEVVAVKRLKTLKALDGFPLTSLREVMALKHIERQRERWRAANHSTADPLPEIIALRDVLLSRMEPRTDEQHQTTCEEVEASKKNKDASLDVGDATARPAHDIHLIFSYASCSLAGLLEKRFAFSSVELTYVFHKITLGVRKLHEMGIIHRDIKADNILLTESGEVQLADFGLCAFASSGNRALTPSMINLSYRPPEMLLGSIAYDERVDVWSIGCLLAQIFLGVPPFFKRRSAAEQAAVQKHNRSSQTELEQLGLICEVLGPLPRDPDVFDPATCRHLRDLQHLRVAYAASGGTATPALHPLFAKSFLFNEYHGFRSWFTARVEERRRQVDQLPASRRFPVLMPTESCLDALSRIFQLDPKKRPSAAELLTLKFFQFLSSHEEASIRKNLASRLTAYQGSHIAPR